MQNEDKAMPTIQKRLVYERQHQKLKTYEQAVQKRKGECNSINQRCMCECVYLSAVFVRAYTHEGFDKTRCIASSQLNKMGTQIHTLPVNDCILLPSLYLHHFFGL